MGYPLTKIPKIATFQNQYPHSLKSLSIKLEHHQKLFQSLFFRKINKEKISYFLKKSWVNPFTKSPKMAKFKTRNLYSKKDLSIKL